jgi:hypothetical protein
LGIPPKREDKDKFMRDGLSPAVSAFANSEGGIIVIGMDEGHSKPRVASQLDGALIGPGNAIESLEQFQQMVDSCISPFLPGLAMRRVPLSGHLDGRIVLVVHVPQGTTAYQARNHLYYSRSEFETKSMPDHEVRLRMQRGRTPQAQLELERLHCTSADQEFQRRVEQKERIAAQREAEEMVLIPRQMRESLDAPRRDFDEYDFQFAIRNTGELTIRDFVLAIRAVSRDDQLWFTSDKGPISNLGSRFRFLRAAEMGMPNRVPAKKLFPGDRMIFPDDKWTLRVSGAVTREAGKLVIEWTIFLDDTTPLNGIIDVGVALQRATPPDGSD